MLADALGARGKTLAVIARDMLEGLRLGELKLLRSRFEHTPEQTAQIDEIIALREASGSALPGVLLRPIVEAGSNVEHQESTGPASPVAQERAAAVALLRHHARIAREKNASGDFHVPLEYAADLIERGEHAK